MHNRAQSTLTALFLASCWATSPPSRALADPPSTQPAFERPEAAIGQPEVTLDRHPRHRPLMRLLDDLGVGEAFDQAGINFFGHVQVSYTGSITSPQDHIQYGNDGKILERINLGRFTDLQSDRLLLNQI